MSWSDKIKRGLAVGAVAALGTQLMYGSTGATLLFGQEVPGSVAVGLAAAGGSVAADVAHEQLPGTGIGDMGASLVEAGVAGVVTAGAADYLGVASGITLEAGALGVASLYAGRYAYNSLGGGGILI